MRVLKQIAGLVVGMVLLGGAGVSWAQCGCEVPVLPGPAASIGTSYLPVLAEPVVQPAPAPVVVYQPVVAAPVVTPVVVYRPAVSVVPVSPVVVYRPVVGEVIAPPPILVGKPTIIRTKVYYPGEPIRNLIKAITP